MKLTRVFACLLLLPILAVSATGCRKGSDKIKVAFVTNNPEEFWSYAEAGCKKAGKDFPDTEITFKRPDPGLTSKQKEIIDALLNQGVQAVAVSVIDPDNQADYLKKIAAQVPLLTQDNDAPTSGRKCYIGTDNYTAGKAVGRMVKEALPEGGTIAIFVGKMESLNAQQRRQGVLDELADGKDVEGKKDDQGWWFGKYNLLSSGSGHGAFTDEAKRKLAKENADDVLKSKYKGDYEKLCMVGLWAYNPPTIYEAVKAYDKVGKVKIVGFDEADETLAGIKDGHIHGTVVQQPFEFGYQAVKVMRDLVKGNTKDIPANGIHHIPFKEIRQNNVAEFQNYLNELKASVKN